MLPRAVAVLVFAMSMPVCEGHLLSMVRVTLANRGGHFSPSRTQQILSLMLPGLCGCQLFLPHGHFLVLAAWQWPGQWCGTYRWSTGPSTPYLESLFTLRGHMCTLSIYFISLVVADCSNMCILDSQFSAPCAIQNQVLLSLLLSHRTYLKSAHLRDDAHHLA